LVNNSFLPVKINDVDSLKKLHRFVMPLHFAVYNNYKSYLSREI